MKQGLCRYCVPWPIPGRKKCDYCVGFRDPNRKKNRKAAKAEKERGK